jgi:hypothetical protein
MIATIFVFAQATTNPTSKTGSVESRSTNTLSASEQLLVAGSRKAIIQTGITAAYFDTHFKLIEVINKPSDRRVSWRFTINEYQTIIQDSIGYYTQGSEHFYTHAVAARLGQTSEIKKTLKKARALRSLRACLGSYLTPSIEYGAIDGQAQLMLVAHSSKRRSEREMEAEEKREREKEQAAAKLGSSATDTIESEGEENDRPPSIMAAVNLQTGKCTKGLGVIAP